MSALPPKAEVVLGFFLWRRVTATELLECDRPATLLAGKIRRRQFWKSLPMTRLALLGCRVRRFFAALPRPGNLPSRRRAAAFDFDALAQRIHRIDHVDAQSGAGSFSSWVTATSQARRRACGACASGYPTCAACGRVYELASSTARMAVRNMPSKVPAPPIVASGAPRSRTLSKLVRSAPINVPRLPAI